MSKRFLFVLLAGLFLAPSPVVSSFAAQAPSLAAFEPAPPPAKKHKKKKEKTRKSSEPASLEAPAAGPAFNVLRYAFVDPESGQLRLAGDYDPAAPVAIAYLEVLAASMQLTSPDSGFSLDWTESSHAAIDVLIADFKSQPKKYMRNLRRVHERGGGSLNERGIWLLESHGLSVPEQPMDRFDKLYFFFLATGREEASQAVNVMRPARPGDPIRFDRLFDFLCPGLERQIQYHLNHGNLTVDEAEDNKQETFLKRLSEVFALGIADEAVSIYRESRASDDSNTVLSSMDLALKPFNREMPRLLPRLVHEAIGLLDPLAVPAALVVPHWDTQPESSLFFSEGLVPRSALSKLAFEADYQLKRLNADARLADRLPGLRQQPAWIYNLQKPGAPSLDPSKVRTWISPERIDLSESGDGSVIGFGEAAMRIHFRSSDPHRLGHEGESLHPLYEDYSNWLSTNFDSLAREIPEFQRLQEAAKIMALASRLRARGHQPRPPRGWKKVWDPPRTVTGFVRFIVEEPVIGVLAEGGIAFTPDENINVTVDPNLKAAAEAFLKGQQGQNSAVLESDSEALAETSPELKALQKELGKLEASLPKCPKGEDPLRFTCGHCAGGKGQMFEFPSCATQYRDAVESYHKLLHAPPPSTSGKKQRAPKVEAP